MTEWMGRYRALVAAIVQHTNVVMEGESLRKYMYDGVYLSTKEWQVLEYIVEHREDDAKMIHMSEALGFHQSYFSKITRTLSNLGLVERFHIEGNKKDVDELPALVKHDVQFVFVKDVAEVFECAFV